MKKYRWKSNAWLLNSTMLFLFPIFDGKKNLSIALYIKQKKGGKFSIQISRCALDRFYSIQMFEIQSMFFWFSAPHFLPSKPLENQSKPFDGRKNQIMWKKRPDGKNANLLLFYRRCSKFRKLVLEYCSRSWL